VLYSGLYIVLILPLQFKLLLVCMYCTDVVQLGAAQTMYVLARFGPHDGDTATPLCTKTQT
jgi:hypothetical protein